MQRHGHPDVAQIARRIAFVHDVIVVGKAKTAAVRTENVHMAAAAQRRACRGGDIQRVEGDGQLAIRFTDDHPAAVVKIILPGAVGVLRTVDKGITRRRIGADRDHADVGAVLGAINHLHRAAGDVDPLDAQTGERGAARAHVISQPLAVRRPDVDIG